MFSDIPIPPQKIFNFVLHNRSTMFFLILTYKCQLLLSINELKTRIRYQNSSQTKSNIYFKN